MPHQPLQLADNKLPPSVSKSRVVFTSQACNNSPIRQVPEHELLPVVDVVSHVAVAGGGWGGWHADLDIAACHFEPSVGCSRVLLIHEFVASNHVVIVEHVVVVIIIVEQ